MKEDDDSLLQSVHETQSTIWYDGIQGEDSLVVLYVLQ